MYTSPKALPCCLFTASFFDKHSYAYVVETGLYYLQSRYYNPELGRFLNADALASTGQGFLGNNMFTYCLNNPVNTIDPNGMCSYSVYYGGAVGEEGCYRCKNLYVGYRDVTDEVRVALTSAVEDALEYRKLIKILFGDDPLGTMCTLDQFYNLVNHQAPWDIKYQAQWESTIGTPYPGEDTIIMVGDMPMTPELLGNFTYGVLGYAYEFPLEWLIGGSYYAAGFPTSGDPLMNEVFIDWTMIILGYECAKQAFESTGGV